MSAFSMVKRVNFRLAVNLRHFSVAPKSSAGVVTVEVPRKAATTIIMAKDRKWGEHDSPPAGESFHLLMVKRSSKSKFMPSLYVFPGGVVEQDDKHMQWMDLLEKASRITGHQNIVSVNIQNDPVQEETLADRICAQRELFEETGLLIGAAMEGNKAFPITVDTLVRRIIERTENAGKNSADEIPHYHLLQKTAREKGLTIHEMLRLEVNERPLRFLTRVLGQLGMSPAAPSLFPFARWVTPTFERKRFDTNFYLTGLDAYSDDVAQALRMHKVKDIPKGVSPKEWIENGQARTVAEEAAEEVSAAVWLSPREALHRASLGELSLAPPTFYVLSQLASFHTMEEALNYCSDAVSDNLKPLRPWLAQRIVEGNTNARKGANDPAAYSLPPGSFIALPGDHAHSLAAHIKPTDNGKIYSQFLPFMPLSGDAVSVKTVRDSKAIHRIVLPSSTSESYEIQISDPMGTRQFQTFNRSTMKQ